MSVQCFIIYWVSALVQRYFVELFNVVTFVTVSGEVPDEPCISAVSGCVFERRLLKKFVDENGTDPTNNEPLSMDQVVDIKVIYSKITF